MKILTPFIILHFLAQPVFAQRKVYRDPVMTPAVEKLLRSRSVWHIGHLRSTGEEGDNSSKEDELPLAVDNSRNAFFPPIIN